MIWLTVRQHRAELLLLFGMVMVLCIALLITGRLNYHLYNHLGIAACLKAIAQQSDACGQAFGQFTTASYSGLQPFLFWLNLIPALYGILIGVPLLGREYEQGTFRFAWTQGVTLRRWLLTKLGLLLGIGLLLAIPLTIILTWWNMPFTRFEGPGNYLAPGFDGPYSLTYYDFTGVIPAAYLIFAFALGVAAGAFFRRVIPAVAATFLYVPLWQVMDNIWRRNLIPPVVKYYSPARLQDTPKLSITDWVLGGGVADSRGRPMTDLSVCAQFSDPNQGNQCLANHGYQYFEAYHPLSHFWPMQGVEAGILIAAAVLLMGGALWWTARRTV